MVKLPALGGYHIVASDKERPLATESTTNTTTIIARADQHDIDLLGKAGSRVNFGSIGTHRCALPAGRADRFDWLIDGERWKARVEEAEKNGTAAVAHLRPR